MIPKETAAVYILIFTQTHTIFIGYIILYVFVHILGFSIIFILISRIRDKAVDVEKCYKQQRGGEKDLLNLVVVGHVDAGKSTLMGHLLYLQVRSLSSDAYCSLVSFSFFLLF